MYTGLLQNFIALLKDALLSRYVNWSVLLPILKYRGMPVFIFKTFRMYKKEKAKVTAILDGFLFNVNYIR